MANLMAAERGFSFLQDFQWSGDAPWMFSFSSNAPRNDSAPGTSAPTPFSSPSQGNALQQPITLKAKAPPLGLVFSIFFPCADP